MVTPTFAVLLVRDSTDRVLEQMAEDRLVRPDAVCIGPVDRKRVPIGKRG